MSEAGAILKRNVVKTASTLSVQCCLRKYTEKLIQCLMVYISVNADNLIKHYQIIVIKAFCIFVCLPATTRDIV
ncbi:hypothetical protein DPX16_19637 [Anabarilius grahami]|uniref:Uncharacterized protein n=1 Tax=Anabarilius grahami TaxID=495550 RepID=A0A3N0XKT3_ANAGA|nr:hypothetical protein DPX16_19637 [Anabarilius grahami]